VNTYSLSNSLFSPKNVDAIEITYRLKRLGKTQTQIARELGIGQGVVSNVIHDRATAHAVASYIAELLGSPIEELWPERYRFRPRGPAPNRGQGTRNSAKENTANKGEEME